MHDFIKDGEMVTNMLNYEGYLSVKMMISLRLKTYQKNWFVLRKNSLSINGWKLLIWRHLLAKWIFCGNFLGTQKSFLLNSFGTF